MSEHMPTPWEVDADFDYDLCFTEGGQTISGWQIYGPKSWPVAAAWVEGIVDRHTGRANAEFIVKAVNSHDRLVEALEAECYECVLIGGGSIWHLNRCGVTNGTADCISDCVKARAALAAARGEGE